MTDAPPAKDIATLSGAHALERNVRLSESMLWQVQRQYFASEGLRAWSTDTVPHYITCNPSIANSYAEMVLAFLRDCDAQGRLDRTRPVPIVELGSGSGRFAFSLLSRLETLLAGSLLNGTRVRYVLTDFAPGKLDALKEHPALADWIAAGVVDFATVDVMTPGPVRLECSGEEILGSGEDGGTPLVLLANYVLDSVPQDCFAVREGELHEVLLSVISPVPDPDLSQPAVLESLALEWHARPTSGDHYADESCDRVLAHYRDALDDTTVLFPAPMLACVRRLEEAAGGPLLWIAADKGYAREEDLLNQDAPGLVRHGGAFSLMVNFDAVGRWTTGRGGIECRPRHRPASLVVAAYVLGTQGAAFPETTGAYENHLATGGPDDFFAVRSLIKPASTPLTIEQMLAFLRVTGWDSAVFLECFSTLLDLAPAMDEALKPDVALACRLVGERYFSIGEDADVELCLGLVLSAIHFFRESLPYFEASLRHRGPSANALFGLAVAHYGLRDLDAALKYAQEALGQEPGFSGARNLRATVEAQLAVGPT